MPDPLCAPEIHPFTLTKPATFPLKMNNPANPHPSSFKSTPTIALRRAYNTSSPLPMGSPLNLTKPATLAPAQNPAVNTHHPSSTLRRMHGSTHQVLFLWIQPFMLTKSVTIPLSTWPNSQSPSFFSSVPYMCEGLDVLIKIRYIYFQCFLSWCFTSTETISFIRGRLYTYSYNVTTRMIPALRWAAMRAILMFY